VAVRPFAGVAGGDCLRISVGPWSMLEQFLAAFDEVRQLDGMGSA
jgi:hypothetical protein